MDSLIVAEKLEALRRCVKRIEDKRTVSGEALRQDIDRQDILSLNLTRAVQLCVDVATHILTDTDQPAPQTMGEAFDLLAAQNIISDTLCVHMRAAVGFRNIAVHNYQVIDWDIVHTITHQGLDDFREYASRIAALLDE
ncbi:MAG: DUF86 domain-containing protein [Aquisalimonadaceae bacterium]